MHSFTVYEFGSREFRVVLGVHAAHANAGASSVRVYQGSEPQSAVLAAFSGETRADIKSQIARFLSPEMARKVERNTAFGPLVQNSAPRPTSDAGADSAAAAVNSGGATYSYIVNVWRSREDRQKWADPIAQYHAVATLPDDAGRQCLRESGHLTGYAEVSLENGDFCGEVTL